MDNVLKEKCALCDVLTEIVFNKLEWSWNDMLDCVLDKDENYITGDDFGSVVFQPINYYGMKYNQINFWGDGTLELQNDCGESINWTDFENDFLKLVIERLK